MLSITATFDDDQWFTGGRDTTVDKLGRLFGNLIRQKARELKERPPEFQDAASVTELRTQLSELNRQWRDQEVTGLISQIRQRRDKAQGVKIAARLGRLREMLKEEEGKDTDISPDSLRALLVFFNRLENFRLPEFSLTPEAEVYLRWKDGPKRLFAVHFENHRRVRFTVFSPNPRHSDFVNRLSGIETVDTVLQTAENACSVRKWICD